MNLTLSIPYADLVVRGRYLSAECETSDKPRVPECYEVESVQWWKELEWIARFEIIELVDHLTPESLTEGESVYPASCRAPREHGAMPPGGPDVA